MLNLEDAIDVIKRSNLKMVFEGFEDHLSNHIKARDKLIRRSDPLRALETEYDDDKKVADLDDIQYYVGSGHPDEYFRIQVVFPINDSGNTVKASSYFYVKDYLNGSVEVSAIIEEIVNGAKQAFRNSIKKGEIDAFSDEFDKQKAEFTRHINLISSDQGKEIIVGILEDLKPVIHKAVRAKNFHDAKDRVYSGLQADEEELEKEFLREHPIRVGEKLFGVAGKVRRERNFTVVNVNDKNIVVKADNGGETITIPKNENEVGCYKGNTPDGKWYNLTRAILSRIFRSAYRYEGNDDEKKLKKYLNNESEEVYKGVSNILERLEK